MEHTFMDVEELPTKKQDYPEALATLIMVILDNFPEYIDGADNPVQTAIKIIKDLGKAKRVDAKMNLLDSRIAKGETT